MLPTGYSWLTKYMEQGEPATIVEALKLYGTADPPGAVASPTLDWAKELKISDYNRANIPWCGLFMALISTRAKALPIPAKPLWALNWESYGVYPGEGPMFGDVLVFERPGGGHVGLYIGEDNGTYHVLGGNENNQVEIARFLKMRMKAYRRPKYDNLPSTVQKILLARTGEWLHEPTESIAVAEITKDAKDIGV